MDALAELTRLVSVDSVSSRPMVDLAAHVAQRCEDVGLRASILPMPGHSGKANVIARVGPDRPGGLTLSGHLDVVPTEGQPWTTDPFTATVRDGRVYGRGTADMKGFVAASLQALGRVDVARLSRPLLLVWTCDEEVGCLGSAALAASGLGDGPVPSACLIGEPTDFRILRMHPGHVAVRVVVRGRAAHSSKPHLGVNAIEAAAAVVEACRDVAAELAQEVHFPDLLDPPFVPLNVARIHGGSAINIVPDEVTIDLGYRPVPGMAVADVFDRLQRRLERLPRPHTGLHAEISRVTPSLLTPAGTPLERMLRAHAARPDVGAATFATDGGNLEKLGMAPLVFGPGSIDVAHQADEYVAIDALHRAVDVVEALVREACA